MKWFRALLSSFAGLSALAIFSGRKHRGGHVATFIGVDEALRSAHFKLDAARLFLKEMSDDLMPVSGRSPYMQQSNLLVWSYLIHGKNGSTHTWMHSSSPQIQYPILLRRGAVQAIIPQ